MSTPSYFTFDGDPPNSVAPRRPGIDDVGGAAKLDDQQYPPDPQTMPTAADENQAERLLVGYGKVVPAIIISVKFTAGAPVLDAFAAVGFNITTPDITFTDHADGDTSVLIATGELPPVSWKPMGLTLNEDVEIDRMRAIPVTNGVRVKTKLGAVLTNCAFTIALSGV